MGERILLVEDDDSVRQIAVMSLEALGGFEVLAAASGPQALAAAPAFAPQLLLLDVAMPEMQGPDVLRALRALPGLAHVPAAFLTASTTAADVSRLRNLGAVDVIAKPFDPQHLCARVKAALQAPPPSDAGGKPVALVVEDDDGIAYLLRFILEQRGWTVRWVADGNAALLEIQRDEPPQVVVLDIMLPGVDGLTLLERLRARQAWQTVPVMMLTAQGDEPAVRRALAAGAQDYLGKPFDPQEFAARLERLRPAGA